MNDLCGRPSGQYFVIADCNTIRGIVLEHRLYTLE